MKHLRNLERMIQPDAPELAAWAQELRDRLVEARTTRIDPTSQVAPVPSAVEVQRRIQQFVYEKVQYAWDWEVWGSADYMPTVQEMFAQAQSRDGGKLREDCDGRAVMAASLMRRLGHRAELVTDLRHVWVKTPQGEWMGPGGKKAVSSTARGNQVAWGTVIGNVPMSLSYGIAVFPLWRELLILATAYVLMLHRRMAWRRAAIAAMFLLQGLLFMRCGVLVPETVAGFAKSWPAVVGILHLVAGFGVLFMASRRARRTAFHVGRNHLD